MKKKKTEQLPATIGPATVAFSYNGVDFAFDDRQFINLTAMWKAAGSPTNKNPNDWSRTDQGSGFIADLAKSSNTAKNRIWKSVRGQHLGGTWAHWQISVAYAKYLSHEFHRLVNEAFRQYMKEEADPGLKAQRAARAYIQQGKEAEWAVERIEGIFQRKSFTSTMQDHNCKRVGDDNPFAEGTRSISLQVLGKTPSEIKKEKGLAKSARTRDHLSKHELVRLRFAESEAERLIKEEAADGNVECVDVCRRAGKAVKLAIESLSKKTG